jgi:hypothetical protein
MGFGFFGLRVVPAEFAMVRDVAEITARITDYVSCAVGLTWSSSGMIPYLILDAGITGDMS